MTAQHNIIRLHLQHLEAEMKAAELWSVTPPSAEALASTMPFMYDTLKVEQWLQWVFVPRMHALIDAGAPLPGSCSVHPLAEHEWRQAYASGQVPVKVLARIRQIDEALSGESAD